MTYILSRLGRKSPHPKTPPCRHLEKLYGPSNHRPAEQDDKVLNYVPPDDLYKRWEKDLEQQQKGTVEPDAGGDPRQDLLSFFQQMLHDIIRLHHPNFLGHPTCVPAPPAALAELVGSLLDPGMGVYEHGTTGVVLERNMTKKMGALIGWDQQKCEGFFTDGGTLGNLTALLCARQVMISEDDDIWQHGYKGKQYGFLVSSEAHYSVARDIQVMGMGHRGVVSVLVDDYFRMRTDLLPDYLEKAKSEGIAIIGVVSSDCDTATGSHDDIGSIANFCQANNLWLHVDGAYGGCALFSQKHRHQLKGIEKADSFSVDFHKMLMTPVLVTAVLFRNGYNSYQTFAQKASYLWDQDEKHDWYNLGKRTFELTKSFSSIRVYALWRTFGTTLFEQSV
jgi:L-2,4-diaminobutyrate decarboxylase